MVSCAFFNPQSAERVGRILLYDNLVSSYSHFSHRPQLSYTTVLDNDLAGHNIYESDLDLRCDMM